MEYFEESRRNGIRPCTCAISAIYYDFISLQHATRRSLKYIILSPERNAFQLHDRHSDACYEYHLILVFKLSDPKVFQYAKARGTETAIAGVATLVLCTRTAKRLIAARTSPTFQTFPADLPRTTTGVASFEHHPIRDVWSCRRTPVFF